METKNNENLKSLLEQHDELYNQLILRKKQIKNDNIFPLDDVIYSNIYNKFVKIYNLIKKN